MEPPPPAKRAKLEDTTTSAATVAGSGNFRAVADLFAGAKNIMVLVGAGISVSAGIPDFRSPGGLFSMIEEAREGCSALAALPEPAELFNIDYFRDDDGAAFYSLAHRFMPADPADDDGDAGRASGAGAGAAAAAAGPRPTRTHRFLAQLAARGKLLRVYTQNIARHMILQSTFRLDALLLCINIPAYLLCAIPI